VLKGCGEKPLRDFAKQLHEAGIWQKYNAKVTPEEVADLDGLRDLLLNVCKRNKGEGLLAEFLLSQPISEIPVYIHKTLASIRAIVQPPAQPSDGIRDENPE